MRFSRILSVSAIALALIGCSRSAQENMMEDSMERETGNEADVDIQADGSVKVETDEGTFQAGGSGEVPADWPNDVTVYENATVQFSGSSNPTTGEAGLALMLTTSDTVSQVSSFYTQSLKAAGWTITATMQQGEMTIIGATKGDRAFSLSAVQADGQTTITIGITKE